MKRLFVILSAACLILLSGCKRDAVPVTMTFPEVPADLKIACPDLATLNPNTTKLSDLLDVVTDNYSTYYECRARVDVWIEWYDTQKKIFDKISK
jgi:hypothetical protein